MRTTPAIPGSCTLAASAADLARAGYGLWILRQQEAAAACLRFAFERLAQPRMPGEGYLGFTGPVGPGV